MSTLTDRDAFIATVLPGIVTGVMASRPPGFGPSTRLNDLADLAPEIAACARRIADAVMEERGLQA